MSKDKKTRGFTFTLNNYTEDDVAQLQALKCQYIIFGKEVAPTTGTPHLQGYVYFTGPRHIGGVRRLFKWHVDIPEGSASENAIYCGKDENPFIKGRRPSDQEAKGKRTQDDWALFRACAKRGDFDSIPDHLYCRYIANAKRIHVEDRPPPEDLQGEGELQVGLWIHGPPRTGKSRYARENFKPLYEKQLNKWWDKYAGEDYVILDDFAPEHAVYLTGFLKRWTDRYVFSGEVKNGTVRARPKRVIITSNYSMDECFRGVDLEALKMRFEIKFMA